ncbi:MAG: substrate-binding domain-containing protein [Chloroflexi bacterium]|nr:substrate-binding domain-containing protein [Chloroflexota bacterium]
MPHDDFVGRHIGDFVIEERIGQGAMAMVYRAFQPSINRHVALKVIRLNEGQGQHEEFRRRFAYEAEVIAQLEHIHILPIYAYGIADDVAYLAMRWLRGGTLADLMRRDRLPLDRVAEIFKQVAQGLSYAHSKGIIHRDLKPSNIMLDDAGNAYLTDFGLAKLAEGSLEITKPGTIVGTPAYMSPEQLRGEPLDHRTDIYSLGVILYNMVVGRLPFDTSSTDLVSIIYQHLEKAPTPPTQINPEIPIEVEMVILCALQKNRDQRYDSAIEMSRALDLALGRPVGSSDHLPLPKHASTPLSAVQLSSASQVIQRRPGFYLAIGAALVVLTLVLIAVIVSTISGNNQAVQSATAQAVTRTAVAAAWTPTPLPRAVVHQGERGPASVVVPNQSEIAAARARLGERGFITYIACTLESEFHSGLAREIRDMATRYGLDLRVYDSDADPYRQVTQIERARSDGTTGLIICPLDPSLLRNTLASAQAQKIPMVFFALDMPSYGGVLVAGDNYELGLEPGRLAGQIIQREMGGRADVVILDYPDLPDIVQRADGIEAGIREFAPEAHIVGRFLGGTRDNGRASVEKLIQEGVPFNVIVSINDAGAFGAIDAMQAAGFAPDSVVITSVDGELLAQQYIHDNYFMRGSVQSSRIETAHALVNTMVKLLAGGSVPENIIVPPGQMITRDTLSAREDFATGSEATPEATP